MIEQIKQLSQSRVLVVGDLMLDRYWQGDTKKISPEAPVPIIKLCSEQEFPGGAGNVVRNIASLGAMTQIVGAIGNDTEGKKIKQLLTDPKIVFDLVQLEDYPTTTKLRVISQHQQLLRLDLENTLENFSGERLLGLCDKYLQDADVVILSDYAKGVLMQPELLIQEARKRKIPILVDPKGSDFSKYKGASVLTPNRKEFEEVVGKWGSIKELVDLTKKLIKKFNFGAIIITLGADGMILVDSNDNIVQIPAHTEEVYDVTGAGDTVIALLGCAIGQGISLEIAMSMANLAAGLVIKKLGAGAVSVDELIAAEKEHDHTGIISVSKLLELVKEAKNRGQKIVMTNGCFDIVHAGHISYLKNAKKLGNKLIVALNDDESVARIKGKNRPIHKLNHRQEVIAELQSVDWVVAFSEDTPKDLIGKVLPDILVKGGDYTVETVVGSDSVISNGGEVKILNFEEDLSTTNILKSLN